MHYPGFSWTDREMTTIDNAALLEAHVINGSILIAPAVLAAASFFFICGRLYAHLRLIRTPHSLDDIFVVTAWFFSFANVAVLYRGQYQYYIIIFILILSLKQYTTMRSSSSLPASSPMTSNPSSTTPGSSSGSTTLASLSPSSALSSNISACS